MRAECAEILLVRSAALHGYLLINPRSGEDEPSAGVLRAAAEERGVVAHVLEEGDDAAELARAADATALGIAGGDGSLAPVAAVALERGLPFVCIPFGTRNHFARDLGLDRDDPLGALAAYEGGQERVVDVARAGDRLFLNNASLGSYAALVHERERHRRRRQALAGARALGLALRDRHSLEVTIDGMRVSARVILVANNAYELQLFNLGGRQSLSEGKLHLYVAGGLLPGAWNERVGERFTLESATGKLRAALDGEPVELESPVQFEIEPQALRVLVPSPR
jgi:diacylglycerol kinase family enzyme